MQGPLDRRSGHTGILAIEQESGSGVGRPAVGSPRVHEDEFDFWLGSWDVSWADGARGRNVVRKILSGRVVLEEFDGRPGTPLRGTSVSVFDHDAGVWRQTWVDNQGNYLDFAGSFRRGVMDLRRDGGRFAYRMRWLDIERDSVTWLWERRAPDARRWTTLWRLAYARAKAPARPTSRVSSRHGAGN